MNTFQFIGITLYILWLIGCLYFSTNKFQKGWMGNIARGKPFTLRGGIVDFRILTVISLGGLVILLKLLQDAIHT